METLQPIRATSPSRAVVADLATAPDLPARYRASGIEEPSPTGTGPDATAPSAVDHFRPKASALAKLGRIHPDHYEWRLHVAHSFASFGVGLSGFRGRSWGQTGAETAPPWTRDRRPTAETTPAETRDRRPTAEPPPP